VKRSSNGKWWISGAGVLVLILFLFSVFIFLKPSVLEEPVQDLFFQIRGGRDVSDQLVFIYLNDQDIQDLGGWPITRDYYGYITHILSEWNAKVIGFDFLLDSPNNQYPEFDRMLAGFISTAGNVCLPAVLMTEEKNGIVVAGSAVYPDSVFLRSAAGIGFSNLGGETTVRHVPLVMTIEDTIMLSYGLELARLYTGAGHVIIKDNTLCMMRKNHSILNIPIDKNGRMRLNHFGNMDRLQCYGFLDILKMYDENPDTLDFTGKLVLVASTAVSLPVIKQTPLSSRFPASLIHLTVAENCMMNQGLIKWDWMIYVLPFFFIIIAYFIWKRCGFQKAALLTVILVFIVIITAFVAFSIFRIVFPVLGPSVIFILASISLGAMKQKQRRWRITTQRNLLKDQVIKTRDELEAAESRLVAMKKELEKEQEEKSELSSKTVHLAEERTNAVRSLEKHLRDLEEAISTEQDTGRRQFHDIIHASGSSMEMVLSLVEKLGADDISVFILGETGTGKELVARAIHEASPRKRAPFVAVNCGALPETLLESELFGHEKGSFTGATSRRRGRFELADGGTIFLDEITETEQAFQAKLLRVLQEGTLERLGSEQHVKVNVRVIAATNKDIKDEVHQNRFRPDLFYRLNGFSMKIPPLRERKEDIPVLSVFFLEKYGQKKVLSFSEQAIDTLVAYAWPGNVRELENVIRRAALLAGSENRAMIQASDFPEEIRETKESRPPSLTYQPLEEQIIQMLRALKFSRSAIRETAEALGNRDRGTITEYFRGICFETLVGYHFDVPAAVRSIAGTDDNEVIDKVKKKMDAYLKNLVPAGQWQLPDKLDGELPSPFKGLPKKYHECLIQVIRHLQGERTDTE